MFAAHRIASRQSVTFDELERAAQLSEIVDNCKPFYKWALENDKVPKYFSNWSKVITEYHLEKGTKWEEPVAINCAYGYMGYELIQPPKEEESSGEITFDWERESCGPVLFDSDLDFIIETDSDEDSDDSDSDLSLLDEEQNEKINGKYGCHNPDVSDFMSRLDNGALKIQCWFRSHRAKHRVAAIVYIRALGVLKMEAKELPYGTNFKDIPNGMSIMLDEDDIEISDTPISFSSDEEEEELDVLDQIRRFAKTEHESELVNKFQ